MSYTTKNENIVLDINSALSLLGISKQEFYDDIELYQSSYKGSKLIGNFGFKKFKQKYQEFFNIRKIRTPNSKIINTKNSLDGMLRLLTNEKHFSNNILVRDFQVNVRKSFLNIDFLKVVKYLNYHKKFDLINHIVIPKGFLSKISYEYEYREKKIRIDGFRNNVPNIDNWFSYIKNYINIDLNIIWNYIKNSLFLNPKIKFMFGLRLRLEKYEVDFGKEYYNDNIDLGIKTPICNTLTKLKREITSALIRLENYFFNVDSKSKLPKYHIYVSDIIFTQYEIP